MIRKLKSWAVIQKDKLLIWKSRNKNGLPIYTQGSRVYVYPTVEYYGMFVKNPYEPGSTKLFHAAIKPGATVLDIGAQVGYYSVLASKRAGPSGCVYSFEPDKNNFVMLQRNARENCLENIILEYKAVCSETGWREFYIASTPGLHSLYKHPSAKETQISTVECVKVDDYLAGRTIDVAKIDVEGAECDVLDGMQLTIARSPNVTLIVELNPKCLHKANKTVKDLISRLETMEFDVLKIDESNGTTSEIDTMEELEGLKRVNLICLKGDSPIKASSNNIQ